ncbi:MAG: SHOCT domain-containing protein [Gammaproteobacteria bacterium]|nr:SHOCT domain-containing protein [Gammaproteobacteria bacterium]
MLHDGWAFFGMHLLWWLFWVALIVALFLLFAPVPRARRRDTPLELLQRRYAEGEITSDEYEERKAKLERDVTPGQ